MVCGMVWDGIWDDVGWGRMVFVIFKNRTRVLYRNLKHGVIAECFRSDKARTARFLDVF